MRHSARLKSKKVESRRSELVVFVSEAEHNRRFTTYQRTLAFLVNSSWPSQISIRGCVINKI